MTRVKIGLVAPASRVRPEVAEKVTALVASLFGERVSLLIHPQCGLSKGHFAGDDASRAAAFLDMANDASFDALWVARGGYGSSRILSQVLDGLTAAAKEKVYFGYSDAGFLLGSLYKHGYRVAHGPMAADIQRSGGEEAVARALSFLVDRAEDALEPTVLEGKPVAAFNLTILSKMLGTPFEPDLTDHILMLEEVSEHLYAVDRMMFHVTHNASIRRVAGIKLGRVSEVPENDPPFGESEEEIARHWCEVSGIAYLGRADIGHDVANKVVPFGVWRD